MRDHVMISSDVRRKHLELQPEMMIELWAVTKVPDGKWYHDTTNHVRLELLACALSLSLV